MTSAPVRSGIPETGEWTSRFATAPPYRPVSTPTVGRTPYRRPLDAERIAALRWDQPLTEERTGSDEALLAHRLLMNIYESDTLFLPEEGMAARQQDFEAFYDPATRLAADIAKPAVERYVFSFLDRSVQVTGAWDLESVEAHVTAAIDEAVHAESPVLRAIDESADPVRATETMVAQMALDGLTEATAMSQNLGGAYGPEQSELFKIFVDEFGYGVFDAKHSTLFAELCRSIGMTPTAHHYWFFYLPTWMTSNNYFYYVTRNRLGFFRYVGAMTLLEATFAPWFAAMSRRLKAVYGDGVDTRYCDEHAHIDQHHGRMAVRDLLLPIARKHGPAAMRELVRGIEDTKVLGRLADADLVAQMTWHPVAVAGGDRPPTGAPVRPGQDFDTRVAAADERLTVLSGQVELHHSPTGDPLTVPAGSSVVVPRGRLFGVRADRDSVVATTSSAG